MVKRAEKEWLNVTPDVEPQEDTQRRRRALTQEDEVVDAGPQKAKKVRSI